MINKLFFSLLLAVLFIVPTDTPDRLIMLTVSLRHIDTKSAGSCPRYSSRSSRPSHCLLAIGQATMQKPTHTYAYNIPIYRIQARYVRSIPCRRPPLLCFLASVEFAKFRRAKEQSVRRTLLSYMCPTPSAPAHILNIMQPRASLGLGRRGWTGQS